MRKTHIINAFTLTLLTFLALSACNNTDTKSATYESSDLNSEVEGFAAFYSHFHEDSLFQISRISWPLNGNYVQDASGVAKDLKHELQDWMMHRPMIGNPDFVQQFQPLTEDLIAEEIKARTGKYKIERRFARLSGGWNLIYYRVSGI